MWDLSNPVVISAIATATATVLYAILTTLLLLDARASRIAQHDAATMVARFRLSRSNENYAVLYVENLGPAISRDVRLTLQFLERNGAPATPQRVIDVPTMAPGDVDMYEPATLLLGEGDRTLLDLEKVGALGLSLSIEVRWTDRRRRLVRQGPIEHVERQVVDIENFRASVHGGPLVIEPDLTDAVRDIRDDFRKERHQRRAERSFGEPISDPTARAEIEQRVFLAGLEDARALWLARIRTWLGWLRRR